MGSGGINAQMLRQPAGSPAEDLPHPLTFSSHEPPANLVTQVEEGIYLLIVTSWARRPWRRNDWPMLCPTACKRRLSACVTTTTLPGAICLDSFSHRASE